MLELYHVLGCVCFCTGNCSKIEPGKLREHSIHEISAGKLKDTLDNVGDHSLGIKEVTNTYGRFNKYRVKAEQVKEQVQQPVSTNAF